MAGLAEAQVELLDVGVVGELGGRALEDDAARFDDVATVRNRKGAMGVLLDEQRGHAELAVEPLDDREHLVDQPGREPERWLVEEQQARTCHERAPDRELLLSPARQVAGARRAESPQTRQKRIASVKVGGADPPRVSS